MGPELGLFSCFDTSALHLEPPGRRSPPPSIGRQRVPTGTPTSQHARLGGQLGRSLVQTGQVGGGQAEVFGVHRGYGSVEVKAVLECQDKGLVSFLFPSFTGVKAKLMKGRAQDVPGSQTHETVSPESKLRL